MARSKKVKKAKRVKQAVKNAANPKLKKLPKAELKIYRALLVKEREKVGGGLSHIADTTLNKSARDAFPPLVLVSALF